MKMLNPVGEKLFSIILVKDFLSFSFIILDLVKNFFYIVRTINVKLYDSTITT